MEFKWNNSSICELTRPIIKNNPHLMFIKKLYAGRGLELGHIFFSMECTYWQMNVQLPENKVSSLYY